MSSPKSSSHRNPVNKRELRLPYFADKLQQIMDYFPINEVEIAEKTGASQQSVSDWLLGKTCPRKSMLKAISRTLPRHVPLWWLMSGPEAKPLSEVLAQEEQPQSIKEESKQPTIENLARDMLEVIQRYAPQLNLPGVGETGSSDEYGKRAQPK